MPQPWAFLTAMDPNEQRGIIFASVLFTVCCIALFIRETTTYLFNPVVIVVIIGIATWCVLRISIILITRRIVDHFERRSCIFPRIAFFTLPSVIVITPIVISLSVALLFAISYMASIGFIGNRWLVKPVVTLNSIWSLGDSTGNVYLWLIIAIVALLMAWTSSVGWVIVDREDDNLGFGRLEETLSTSTISALLLITMLLLVQPIRHSIPVQYLKSFINRIFSDQ